LPAAGPASPSPASCTRPGTGATSAAASLGKGRAAEHQQRDQSVKVMSHYLPPFSPAYGRVKRNEALVCAVAKRWFWQRFSPFAMTSLVSLAASNFEGSWKVQDTGGKPFDITLSADGTAKGSLRPDMVGTWKEQGTAAVIT